MNELKYLPVGETLPINQTLAGLVPMAIESEQAVLTADIKANGLNEPVVLWQGKIVDGRCRQQACIASNTPIKYKELDSTLTEAEVRIFVKSVNTRRNLTHTQKTMSACRESLRPGAESATKIAKAWGISRDLLANARFISNNNPDLAEQLFNGLAINIIDSRGKAISTNKVSTVYAYLKRLQEATVPQERGYNADSFITTQAGKDYYYQAITSANIPEGDKAIRMYIAELANFKFPI